MAAELPERQEELETGGQVVGTGVFALKSVVAGRGRCFLLRLVSSPTHCSPPIIGRHTELPQTGVLQPLLLEYRN